MTAKGWGEKRRWRIEQKGKRTHNMENSVVIVGGMLRGLYSNEKYNKIKNKQKKKIIKYVLMPSCLHGR